MNRWYTKFRTIYTQIPILSKVGIGLLSTKEERILHSTCAKQSLRLKKDCKLCSATNGIRACSKDNIAVVAIIKNEGKYLGEWIEYHRLLGINHFIIYDNDSSDDTYNALMQYIQDKVVHYHIISTPKSRIHHPQVEAYTDAVFRYKGIYDWIAFIDVDEFIVCEKTDSIPETINSILANARNIKVGGIGVHWLMFGSNGHIKRPDGLVISNYTKRGLDSYPPNRNIKTIANTHAIVKGGIHTPDLFNTYSLINQNGEVIAADGEENIHGIIRINHYACKSQEDLEDKRLRGFGGSSSTRADHDVNDLVDEYMLKYVGVLKQRLKNVK